MARTKFTAALVFLLIAALPRAEAAVIRSKADIHWLQNLKEEAIEQGISAAVVDNALRDFSPNPRVIALDRKQPESTRTFATYKRLVITPSRIREGRELLHMYKEELAEIERRTGVPPQIVVALWGIESGFGANTGNFDVINSLATLAYEGRRASFFKSELFAALRILENESMEPEDLRGSWAGAMGQCQFMPSTYLAYAVDMDGDEYRDIWESETDVLGSIANYLAAEGWQRGQSWGRRLDGKRRASANASVVRPDGANGPAYLVTDNFRALLKWNRSKYFALSVGLLADKINANKRGSLQ
ncbi:MAG: lytic murein transglycosylase [Alphaproteobacteria bacterium]|nr:lytic murein transglycosylase [Alphaproteobacteria bacterium]